MKPNRKKETMKIERNKFEFDGGEVRFTVAGQIIANTVSIAWWLAMIGATIALLILLGIRIGLWFMGVR
jgi:hypothetical protein